MVGASWSFGSVRPMIWTSSAIELQRSCVNDTHRRKAGNTMFGRPNPIPTPLPRGSRTILLVSDCWNRGAATGPLLLLSCAFGDLAPDLTEARDEWRIPTQLKPLRLPLSITMLTRNVKTMIPSTVVALRQYADTTSR